MKNFKRILLWIGGVILLLVVVIAISISILTRRSFPQTEGEITVPGLDGPVEVYRDEFGIPQIYASTEHDLFFAQGYIHAQDRFWQMDFWRHQGAGRLSELLGENAVGVDEYLRTLGWERVSRAELDLLEPEYLGILEVYADGVNAYLADHKGSALSLEYVFLNIINRGYEPAPWEPLNTLTWAKAMAWDLGGNMDTETNRAVLLKSLSESELAQLYPAYDFEKFPVIVTDPHLTTGSTVPETKNNSLLASLYPALSEIQANTAALNEITLGGFEGIGSNSWVVSGDMTDTGMPLLVNDPHLGAQLPSIWYEVGLHCAPKNEGCPWDVTGFSFAGTPGVIIGHNDRVAWGFTNVGPDVMDLYIEKINPDDPNQYEVNGEWVDMEIITERIEVAGGEPIDLQVRLTRHGPVLSDVSLNNFAADAGIDLPEHFAIALRWTALEPGTLSQSILKMNQATDWESFRAGASEFNVPAQNMVYADVDGNIGYQTPGNIPIRNPGHDGMLPVPGWTDEFEWQGYIPFDDLPRTFNPDAGYIVTANNLVVGPEYPYRISEQWAYGFRAQSILDLIEAAPGPISIAYMQQMHGENRDINAEQLVPALLKVDLSDERLINARALLEDWDYQAHMDSAPAALFESFWVHLLAETFHDDLPDFMQPGGGSGWAEIVEDMMADPNHDWWDDSRTGEREDQEAIFARAFGLAVDELEEKLGTDPESWSWGDLHTLTLTHDVMSNFPLIDRLFNEGPYRTSGGSAIVNATGWSARNPYGVVAVPSMRMIVDMSNLQNSVAIHLTGQSGHASHPNYVDMTDLWRMIQYHPMQWDHASIEAAAAGVLRLVP